MPKNKKPAGGRPARNFDPSYARNAKAAKPGSRSKGHRGYRPDEADASAKRPRWSQDERAARGRAPHRSERDDRAPRFQDERAPRRYSEERAPRRFDEERPARRDDDRRSSYGREDASAGSAQRRAPRRDAAERAPRRYSEERAPRRYSEERPARRQGGRPAFDSGDRAPRRYSDERPARRDDRPSYGRDDRAPRRGDDRVRPSTGSGTRFDRPGFQASERRPSSYYPAKGRTPDHLQDDVVLERLEAEAIQADAVEGITFADLGLGENIVRALDSLGAVNPFPIQAATIPAVLEGRDVLGRGRTGSGKTIAFGAPTVERLMNLWVAHREATGEKRGRTMGRAPRALILAPTRELALQIDRTVQPIARSVGLFTTQVYGGVPQARQVGALRRGVDIVIGTPGRIEDLVEQGHLDLGGVVITVLDEADHMCDLGFLEPVQRILRRTSDGGQKLLFSATLDKGVAALVDEFLVDPAVHEVAGEDQASSTIDHRVFVIEQRDKLEIVKQLADRDGKTLVFARTRAFAEQLAEELEWADIAAVSLHGDLNQAKRTRNLEKLTSGRVDVLVATDVAARGIHVDDIDLVIQADAPDEYKTYLHRSGRTGRAGKQGTVVTLITRGRQRRMAELLDRAEIEAEFEQVAPGDALL